MEREQNEENDDNLEEQKEENQQNNQQNQNNEQFYINNPLHLAQYSSSNILPMQNVPEQAQNFLSQNANNISQGNLMSEENEQVPVDPRQMIFNQELNLQESMVFNHLVNQISGPFPIFNLSQGYQSDNLPQKNPLPVHVSEAYYRKREEEIKKATQPGQNEPHMVITVMKTNMVPDLQNKVYVTQDGVVNSHKNTATEDIIIGRQQQAFDTKKNEIHPNDIVLPASDRAISRIHCKIIYKDGFLMNRPVTQDFGTFLFITSQRYEIWKYLPHYILRIIWSFLQPQRKFYIVDIGSVYGTYIKVRPNKSQLAEKGQTYLIGADTIFNIVEVNNGCTQMQNQFETVIQDRKDFLQQLVQEYKNSVKIHGLENEEEFETLVAKYEHEEQQANDTLPLLNFQTPFVKIEIQNTNQQVPTSHIFVAEQKNTQTHNFRIGRSQDCNIVINQNTISRKQSRIFYSNNKWQLQDGDINKESANGTWVSLTDFREKKNGQSRQESDPREIEHGSEIKISDSILKIEIFNNEVKKKKIVEI